MVTDTHTQNDYSNPHACALRVNYNIKNVHTTDAERFVKAIVTTRMASMVGTVSDGLGLVLFT